MADPKAKIEFSFNEKHKEYWANPVPPNEVGNEDDWGRESIYTEVGRALSSWESVEEACTNLLMAFTEVPHGRTFEIIRRAFGSGQSGKFRREAIKHAAAAHFGKNATAYQAQLNKVFNHLRAAEERRDEIAHGRVLGPPQIGGRWLLLPPKHNTKFTDPDNPDPMGYTGALYRFNKDIIWNWGDKFVLLANAVNAYAEEVRTGKFRSPP